ncbi:uncharacterized protein LOC127352297 isoform X6 [Dicentrarchus labrax]|uniref:uncharacterized protein LOC127352297 isoform X3 n=1 Tax=Dicentrarchus labrax TaxID=13489 RepID=UPI0021F5BC05|nr:uncharacterized protein LOC127352297 isoform X3 [Dicentrarchus labrax]XP_051236530.1 uncharacterized protein LOC127352297 isoform X6 [Dicentrarchus labrax]
MELKRPVGDRVCLLLILGHIATAVTLSAGSNNTISQNLDCTNDFENLMFCQFEAQNCTEYHLTVLDTDNKEVNCTFKQCDSGQCCCSLQMLIIYERSHMATLWKGGESMGSKIINITDGIKPKPPTITSVKESNGNFKVMWKTNMDGYFSETLTANVTYRKKGDTEMVSEKVTPTIVDGLNYHEILGRHLEPSTTYVVSVKSFTNWSNRFSDSSNEMEFTTPASPPNLTVVISSLSIAAVIITVAMYGCYAKLKAKWQDNVGKYPNLFNLQRSEQEVLKPVETVISTVYVELPDPDDTKAWWKGSLRDISTGSPQQSSGISTGSSCLSYANTEPADIIARVQDALGKAFPNISPISPLTTIPIPESNKDSDLFSAPYNLCGVRADDMSSGSSVFENKTYSILIPSFLQQITTDSSEDQPQAKMPCDSGYHPSEGDIVISADQKVPACPLVSLSPAVSALMPTDMSYQQCTADSGRFSYAEDSSSSSISGGTNTIASCDPVSKVEGGCESSDEAVGGAAKLNGKTEENPCYGCVPPGSHRFPPVEDDYQSFQNLVDQPDILFPEKRGGEEEEHLSKYPEESFVKMPQSFFSPVVPSSINNVQAGQCLSELQRPFISLISADQSMPVITDGGYQSV